jgi:diadenosine tetraphosphatase ApaH/serine/threonine PP2A family protein phosphatase
MDTGRRILREVRRRGRRACTYGLARLPAYARPRAWSIGPPDFVGVGAQKSGTSWWYRNLLAHPEVFRPKLGMKELYFFRELAFRELTERDVDRYHRLFPRPRGTITGEWTPAYMAEVWTPVLLERAAPDVRVLAILRDPVERYRSAVTHNLQFRRRAEGGIELMNPGSVGMPFDGDPRAAYALVGDDGEVELRRLGYDHERSAAAVRERFPEFGETVARRIEQAAFTA